MNVRALKLTGEGERERMDSGLGRAVVRDPSPGDNGETGGDGHDERVAAFLLADPIRRC